VREMAPRYMVRGRGQNGSDTGEKPGHRGGQYRKRGACWKPARASSIEPIKDAEGACGKRAYDSDVTLVRILAGRSTAAKN